MSQHIYNTCANCHEPYHRHDENTYCDDTKTSKWFPNALAQAIEDNLRPKCAECPYAGEPSTHNSAAREASGYPRF